MIGFKNMIQQMDVDELRSAYVHLLSLPQSTLGLIDTIVTVEAELIRRNEKETKK